ncbi:MAG TPA: hypothetical protein VNS60_07535 [Solirubrobacterales bacterium]|nr:hypothetical protein [Solirubrobacterales bacterium]
MGVDDITTIRVWARTREQLKILAARRGESTGDVVEKLVNVADEEGLLAEIEAGFEKLARDPATLAAYRAASRDIESASDCDALTPKW